MVMGERIVAVAAVLALLGVFVGGTVPASAAPVARPVCPGTGPQLGPPVVGGDDTPGVTRIVFTFVDRTRPVRPDHDADDAPGAGDTCRTLKTAVHVPTGASGPLPLILAVHGRDGDPSRLRPLIDTWVTAGYVVAAPFFLKTDKDRDDQPTGAAVRRQAADARFVLSALLRLDTDPGSPLHDVIDPHRIGAAGISLGGMTVYGLVSNTCCRDPRITAAILLAAVHRPFPDGKYVAQRLPVMLVQGDRDSGYHNSVSAYPVLASPKWFVTLHGSTHSPPFEIPRGPEANLVDRTTTDFWKRYLSGEPSAAAQIADAVRTSHGGASLKRQLKP
jgi:dienelactone hydrolase